MLFKVSTRWTISCELSLEVAILTDSSQTSNAPVNILVEICPSEWMTLGFSLLGYEKKVKPEYPYRWQMRDHFSNLNLFGYLKSAAFVAIVDAWLSAVSRCLFAWKQAFVRVHWLPAVTKRQTQFIAFNFLTIVYVGS